MNPQEGAVRPGSRSDARVAKDAAPHSCRGPLVGAAPGLRRDETGSGSWLCRPGCIRAAGLPVGRAAARMRRDAAPPETARPRPRTRPRAQAARPACRPARSAPFYRRIGIADAHHAVLAPAHRYARLAPGAALLPAQASLMQMLWGRRRGDAPSSLGNRRSCPMPKPADLNQCLTALDQDHTIIAVIEMSQ